MNYRQDDVGTLRMLGLTELQAKVYLAIILSGPSRISAIARNVQIERSEVFRVIPKLMELALVTKILTSPVTYKALPVSEGVTVLFERKDGEHENLRLKAKQVVQIHKNDYSKEKEQGESKYFLFDGMAERRSVSETLMKVERTIDCIIFWDRLARVILKHRELFEKALERGVEMRFFTNITEEEKNGNIVKELKKKKGTFEIKGSTALPATSIILIDNKTADIVTDSSASNTPSGLWSTNNEFVGMIRDYFNLKWSLASGERESMQEDKVASTI